MTCEQLFCEIFCWFCLWIAIEVDRAVPCKHGDAISATPSTTVDLNKNTLKKVIASSDQGTSALFIYNINKYASSGPAHANPFGPAPDRATSDLSGCDAKNMLLGGV